MSKKPDTASALAGILKARRGEELPADPPPAVAAPTKAETPPPPSPAPVPETPSVVANPAKAVEKKGRTGKSSDASYGQFSIWIRKDTRKKAGRALDDAETGQDFSELVQELLEQWLTSRT